MSIQSIHTQTYQPPLSGVGAGFFQLREVELETACVVHEDHRNEHYAIYFIAEGTGHYEIDFQQVTIDGAGLFFLTPGQVFKVISEKVRRGFQLSFDRDFYCVETHGKEIACNGVLFRAPEGQNIIPLNLEQTPPFLQWITRIREELTDPGTAHKTLLETYLRMFVIEALRISQTINLSVESPTPPLIAELNALIEKHFRKEHEISFYAAELGLASRSLSKRLKAYGYPPPSHLLKERIVLEAKRALRYTDESIKSIAYDLGFNDPAYFSRFFTKHTGDSPQNYRK